MSIHSAISDFTLNDVSEQQVSMGWGGREDGRVSVRFSGVLRREK